LPNGARVTDEDEGCEYEVTMTDRIARGTRNRRLREKVIGVALRSKVDRRGQPTTLARDFSRV
jgi:hypothetical protein